MKTGFTLIELSIVLIIIGVLVGGILVGQSIIESVRINKFVGEIGQYEIAFKLFQKKFKTYPGDSPYFSPKGTGNNVMRLGGNFPDSEGNGQGSCEGTVSTDEAIQSWSHLSQSQMIKTKFRPYEPSWCSGSDITLTKEIIPGTIKDDAYNSNLTPYMFNAGNNLSFYFHVNIQRSMAIQNKMGNTLFDNSMRQTGLTRLYGTYVPPHALGGPRPRVVQNIDGNTTYGVFYYFIPN